MSHRNINDQLQPIESLDIVAKNKNGQVKVLSHVDDTKEIKSVYVGSMAFETFRVKTPSSKLKLKRQHDIDTIQRFLKYITNVIFLNMLFHLNNHRNLTKEIL